MFFKNSVCGWGANVYKENVSALEIQTLQTKTTNFP